MATPGQTLRVACRLVDVQDPGAADDHFGRRSHGPFFAHLLCALCRPQSCCSSSLKVLVGLNQEVTCPRCKVSSVHVHEPSVHGADADAGLFGLLGFFLDGTIGWTAIKSESQVSGPSRTSSSDTGIILAQSVFERNWRVMSRWYHCCLRYEWRFCLHLSRHSLPARRYYSPLFDHACCVPLLASLTLPL